MASFGDVKEYPYVGTHLSADRALPLLDQARPGQCGPAAGVVRRNLARGWRRRRASQRRLGKGLSPSAAQCSAKAVVTKRITPLVCEGKTVQSSASRSTGASSGAAKPGFLANVADAVRRRRQYRDPGVQGVPGQHRVDRGPAGSIEGRPWQQSLDIIPSRIGLGRHRRPRARCRRRPKSPS